MASVRESGHLSVPTSSGSHTAPLAHFVSDMAFVSFKLAKKGRVGAQGFDSEEDDTSAAQSTSGPSTSRTAAELQVGRLKEAAALQGARQDNNANRAPAGAATVRPACRRLATEPPPPESGAWP